MTINGLTERLHSVVKQKLGGNWAELARISKLQASTLQTVKTGSDPRGNTLIGICDALNLNSDWLLTGKGEMYRQGENQVTDIKAGYATGIVTPSAVLNRMCLVLNVQADRELSKQLNQEIQQLTKWRESGQVPFEVCESFADAQKISLNWLITGFGDMNGSDAITRRMYLMLQLMEQLPDQQQQEVLSAAKEKQRINKIEQQLAAFMTIKKGS